MSTHKSTAPKRKATIKPENFMEAHEAMKLMKISRATFYRLVNEGKIPGAIKIGSSWRIVSKAFWEAMEERSAS